MTVPLATEAVAAKAEEVEKSEEVAVTVAVTEEESVFRLESAISYRR